MKYPIAWHEDGLKNHDNTNQRKAELIERLVQELQKSEQDANFKRYQIEQAKKQGKDGFDADKFLKKERPKNV